MYTLSDKINLVGITSADDLCVDLEDVGVPISRLLLAEIKRACYQGFK